MLPWFTSRGQIVQTVAAVIGATISALTFFGRILPSPLPHWAQAVGWVALGFTIAMVASLVIQVLTKGKAAAPTARTPTLEIVDVFLEKNDDDTSITFKRKLRVVLQSTVNERITLGPSTSWSRGADDIETMPRNQYTWQVEGSRGWHNNNWTGPEDPQLTINPKMVVQTWIPLQMDASDVDVRRRHERRKLGTLTVPVDVAGKKLVERFEL